MGFSFGRINGVEVACTVLPALARLDTAEPWPGRGGRAVLPALKPVCSTIRLVSNSEGTGFDGGWGWEGGRDSGAESHRLDGR